MGILRNLSGGILVDENGRALYDDLPAMGPLVQSGANPCFFATPGGAVVYLQGSHTWNNLQDFTTSPLFNYTQYITYMQSQSGNFMRMWVWETVKDNLFNPAGKYSPLWYNRSGTAGAADGGNKFDLTSLNSAYFTQLRDRVAAAGDLGIYVSIMLFEGWSIYPAGALSPPNPWTYHPYKLANNINSIDGDPGGVNGSGIYTHDLPNMPAGILALQKAYVARVIDTVNDLQNVLYEISNESPHASDSWQQEIITYIQTYQAGLTNQHRVIRSIAWNNSTNASDYPTGLSSTAEMVVYGNDGSTPGDLADAPGATKVILFDTDHVRPTAATIDVYTWKLFLRGYNVIHMDSADNITGGYGIGIAGYDEPMRRSMRQTALYAARCNLATTLVHDAFSSLGFCIANPGSQYLALAQSGGTFTVNLSAGSGKNFTVEWFKISDETVTTPAHVAGGSSTQSFTSPFSTNASVLFLNEEVVPVVTGGNFILLGQICT